MSSGRSAHVVPCRVYVILARLAPVGVILRRGPTNWVQVLKWDTAHDTVEPGQWFHGRIYERRCDLSPYGTLFIYFARKDGDRAREDAEYTYAWTAISKPPYLTALALWPKGDTWHGGGLFESSTLVWLNHEAEVAVPHPDHQPNGLQVVSNPTASGEDYEIWSRRMARDRWVLLQKGDYRLSQDGWKTERKEVWERLGPDGNTSLRMVHDTVTLQRIYIESFWLMQPGRPDLRIEQAGWADWDQQGRLVFVREGKLFAGDIEGEAIVERELIDLNPNRPYLLETPEWAQKW
jgi:hypothetical protein